MRHKNYILQVYLELYHSKENFTQASGRLIDFIVKCYEQQQKSGIPLIVNLKQLLQF